MLFQRLFFLLCKIKFYSKLVSVILILFIYHVQVKAQQVGNLANVRVEELTDDQIRKFIVETDRLGIKNEQLDQVAIQNGMSASELVKLKNRIKENRKVYNDEENQTTLTKPSSGSRTVDSISMVEQSPLRDFNAAFNSLKSQNFGFDVFNNPRITFEPNLKIPTPKNYTLAADDELLIDVSGYSEANYKLKVSPEGTIRIPLVGAINVNGLTVEQASRIISKRLSNTLYYNIKTGNTFVDVSLGAIRSIKITIVGEANVPGTYTLPSLASAFNALYACGGPSYHGSLRNIQVVRNNSVVATIDVYDYLLHGYKKNDIRLMDQDVIKINTYSTRVELKGEIKKPGMYDIIKGETLGEVLEYAGGFTDNAYTAKILVFKNTSKDRQVSNITEAELASVVPQKGDSYIVGKINNRFSNRISLKGAVNRPGEYELKNSMTLMQLINEADGLREDAFTGRGTIHRLKDDLSPEIVSFNVEQLLNGKAKDIVLKKEDRVNIFSRFDLKEGYYVKIEGEVASPGVFLFEDGMTAEDMILMAGGFKESASGKRVEISRRVRDADSAAVSVPNTTTAIIYQKDINSDLRDSAGIDKFILKPYDEISVYKAPGYFEQKNVVIEGEVMYAGKYTLEAKNDRISDLIKRSGGFTPEAYLKGAVLVRSKRLTKTEQANAAQGLSNLIKENYSSGTKEELLQFEIARTVNKPSESIGIELEEIIENPASEYDLFLNDGDTLRIPKQLQTVRVNGEVLYPTLVRFNDEFKFKDYILGAGGYSERSSWKKSYAVYPNGSIKGTKSFLFFRNYPKITPGTEIYVPVKRERDRLRTGEIISIGATLTTLLLVTYSILK
jgi:protein involved in polysaccharide export with SLBB domain